jgi:hypothetical protein
MLLLALFVFSVFLLAYGNAMNSAVFRANAALASGKQTSVPGPVYRYGALVVIALGLLGVAVGTAVLWFA